MRIVETRRPSFPEAPENVLLSPAGGKRWQVVCGDAAHWRAGLYSPPETRREEVQELERHDCPEMFLLLSGHLTLVLAENGGLRELPLEAGRPIVVTAPHSGYCPGGPHSGVALVVERDEFSTEYRVTNEWLETSKSHSK